ncbi:MAG: hypothetical protein ACREBG_04505 [Pyrinomonadaceae bacterium]
MLALIVVVLIAGNVSAQESQCKAKLADLPQAPELSGFRLGMTTAQVKTRVPQVVFGRTDALGVSKTTINPYFDERIDKSAFAGVRSISLDFFEGRLTSIWIGYEASFKWQTMDDFVKGISTAFSVPSTWTPWKSRGLRLRCEDFEMTVTLVARSPSFRILDLTAEETLTARRAALEEEKTAAEENSEETREIVGDKESKTYYPEGCQPTKEIGENNRMVFKTAEEAVKAGYKPAKNCP